MTAGISNLRHKEDGFFCHQVRSVSFSRVVTVALEKDWVAHRGTKAKIRIPRK